ncbi:glycine dehydrogenase, partial [Phenoliferia sp. Uapishka_3]
MLSAGCRRTTRAIRTLQAQRPAATTRAALPSSRLELAPFIVGRHILARSLATTTSLSPDAVRVPADSLFAPLDSFTRRHVGPQPASVNKMLEHLGFDSLDAFIAECVPPSIRIETSVVSEEGENAIVPLSEQELLRRAAELGAKNKVNTSFIGMGYHQAVTPSVILRNMLENPNWYTQYSPYQAEIAQGRLESLINFQSLTTSLTGLDIANASLLDEGTAAAEAMILAYGQLRSAKHTFYVDRSVLPQTLAVVQNRAAPFGIKVVVGNVKKLLAEGGDAAQHKDLIGVLLQYPDVRGEVADWKVVADRTHELGGFVTVATDFLALTVLTPPGEWGADIAFGNSARFGVPMAYGGPHAAFFACTDVLKRRMPGRLIGLSKDAEGKPAYRLALQTREQHIRREKATSNICTAQALLANVASMYAVYHGPEGLRQIAEKVHGLARVVKHGVEKLGHKVINNTFFDTLTIRLSVAASIVHQEAERVGINLRRVDDDHVGVSFDESNTVEDIVALLNVFVACKTSYRASKPYTPATLVKFADSLNIPAPRPTSASLGQLSTGANIPALTSPAIPTHLSRTSPILTQPVWNSHHSETDILRYINYLAAKDLSLVHAMMQLNSTTSMIPFTTPAFAKMHPFAPVNQAQGYAEMMEELAKDLSTMTGLPGCSLQPNSGAQGEYAGLRVIRAYHASRGDEKRDICLIPVSAHGTNPASAIMSGMKVIPVKVHSTGFLDLEDLRAKADKYRDSLAAFMVTYPSTYGVFESGVQEACQIIHDAGGQVYLDGANFNAMIGLTSPGRVGGDVCHLNLHKTFGIPICCADHLTPFLPGHPVIPTGGPEAIGPISAAPFGSASILSISWAYIKMLGADGLTHSSKIAMLSANYAMARLSDHYRVKFVNENNRCAHEFIIDLAEFDNTAGLKVMDFAKRLQDFGIHPPTCSWPLTTAMLVSLSLLAKPSTPAHLETCRLQIEPTESEGLRDIDQFCDAMIKIREEAEEIATGKQPRGNNIITNAPHTMQVVTATEWDRPYTRQEAAYPVERLRRNKFWPSVSRVDDSYGDRNLVCECGTVDEYSS